MKALPHLLAGALLLSFAPPPGPPPLAAAPAQPAPSLTGPAPVPDIDAALPAGPQDSGPNATVRTGLTRPGTGPTLDSQGYTPGSAYNETQDARRRLAPTLNLSVKLQ